MVGIKSIDYSRPTLLFNRHLETIFPALLRSVDDVQYERERIKTPDDDFLDIDWLRQDAGKLVILCHGLEGNTNKAYIKGMARAFFNVGYDALAWNYRGCSGELNKQLRFYHSGATDDLHTVISHALGTGRYTSVYIIGFSLGGNLTLKYLGEQGDKIDPRIQRAVTFSVPLDLHASCHTISRHWIYSQRFIRSLKQKVVAKSKVRDDLDVKGIDLIKSLIEFDDAYTAPIHGFQNAVDYYTRCSSIYFVERIRIPTLIVNALNDPFLDASVNQSDALSNNPLVQFRVSQQGGHVGFTLFNQNGLYWTELKALEFIQSENV